MKSLIFAMAVGSLSLPGDVLDHSVECLSRSAAMKRAISYCAGADEVCNVFVVRLEGSDNLRLEKCLDFSAERCAMAFKMPRSQLMKDCPDWVPAFIKRGGYEFR